MCTSPSVAFAWVGAVLVNIGFISLITWGAATVWPLGFVLASIYTIVLFWLARYLERRDDVTTASQNSDLQRVQEEDQQDELPVNETAVARIPVLVSLVYGLAVISLGVTGFILPINIFPDCSSYNGWQPQWTWTVNTTSVPAPLRAWAGRAISQRRGASFGYIADSDTTLFAGFSDQDAYDQCVWSTSHRHETPKRYKEMASPDYFSTISNSTVCFQRISQHPSVAKEKVITCSDGSNFRSTKDARRGVDFIASDGLLWFKQFPSQNGESGFLVFSLDPDSMTVTPHSRRVKTGDSGDCNRSRQIRHQAIVTLFVVGLPVIVISTGLLLQKAIPSMSVTAYVGLTILFASIVTAVVPMNQPEAVYKWWFSITGLLLLVILSFFILAGDVATPSKYNDSFRWGLVVGGLSFFGGMVALLLDSNMDELLRWILLNVLAFVPLILLGAATDTTFLMILGGIGCLMDSWRFADFVANHVNARVRAPIQFLVFSLTGLVVGALGKCLSYFQPQAKVLAEGFVQTAVAGLSSVTERQNHTDNDPGRPVVRLEGQPLLDANESSATPGHDAA